MQNEKKMEMEQLVSMGFPNELAAQALAATGGKSILKATEWILSHKSASDGVPTNSLTPPPNSGGPGFQQKLDRFFHLQSKSNPLPAPAAVHGYIQLQEEENNAGISKNRDNDDGQSNPMIPSSSAASDGTTNKRHKLLPNTTINNTNGKNLSEPLAERMRPRTLDDVVGQDHLLSFNSLLRSSIRCNRLPSIVLWGPPGTGKTSLARAIVNSFASSSYRFVSLSAVTCGVKDVRDAVDEARKQKKVNGRSRTVLFVDEVHRFNKSQQDSFLPVIEDGTIVFMGATTENPSFHLTTPLLSRCRVLALTPLKPHHVQTILSRAIHDSDKGLTKSLGGMGAELRVSDSALQFLSENCDGDARVALNALEISATTAAARINPDGINETTGSTTLELDDAREALQCKHLAYDRAGEEHYNLISALHKSMRGSDADASIYWLARMLEGGEQPLYIARRLVRFASEDVGLADPVALNQAVACYQACHFLGMPECDVILAQCVAYLAMAPKSISVYRAIQAAQKVVRESVGQNEGVPLHLRNAPTKLMKEFGYAKGYIYTPDDPSSAQTFLPPSLATFKFLDWPPSKTDDE